MLLLGAKPKRSREMDLDDVFFLRLKLLLVMAGVCLRGGALSPLRKRVMRENAFHVEIEAIHLGRLDRHTCSLTGPPGSIYIDDYFYRCAYDIAVHVQRIARTGRMDGQQRDALACKVEDMKMMRATEAFGRRFPQLACLDDVNVMVSLKPSFFYDGDQQPYAQKACGQETGQSDDGDAVEQGRHIGYDDQC